MRRKFTFHLCGRFSEEKTCRLYAPECHRIHVDTPWGHFMLALTPGARWTTKEQLRWMEWSPRRE